MPIRYPTTGVGKNINIISLQKHTINAGVEALQNALLASSQMVRIATQSGMIKFYWLVAYLWRKISKIRKKRWWSVINPLNHSSLKQNHKLTLKVGTFQDLPVANLSLRRGKYPRKISEPPFMNHVWSVLVGHETLIIYLVHVGECWL